MSKLVSKKLILKKLTNFFMLESEELGVSYYLAKQGLKNLKSMLKPYSQINLHKRNIKHSGLPQIVKSQFTTGMGLLKFSSIADFNKFLLKDFIAAKDSGFLISSLFLKRNVLYLIDFSQFSSLSYFFINYFFCNVLINLIFLWNKVFLGIFLCKVYFFRNLIKKHANA